MDEDVFSKSYIPGTLTKHKLNTLGTHTAVKESRHRFLTHEQQKQGIALIDFQSRQYCALFCPPDLMVHSLILFLISPSLFLACYEKRAALAASHATRIFAEGTCRWPKPKVIAVQSDPSKTYMPHCTILYRCGDDTGCCNSDARTCVARKTQPVDLYFYVSNFFCLFIQSVGRNLLVTLSHRNNMIVTFGGGFVLRRHRPFSKRKKRKSCR